MQFQLSAWAFMKEKQLRNSELQATGALTDNRLCASLIIKYISVNNSTMETVGEIFIFSQFHQRTEFFSACVNAVFLLMPTSIFPHSSAQITSLEKVSVFEQYDYTDFS